MESPSRSRWGMVVKVAIFVMLAIMFRAVFSLLVIPRVQVGFDTTRLTPPRRADGSLDFSQALHEKLSDGITADDNAAVLLTRAFGPAVIPRDLQPRFFEWMQMESMPEAGEYVVSQADFIKLKQAESDKNAIDFDQEIHKEFLNASHRPWTEADFPNVAEWLERNAEPLKLITDATNRPQYYSPIVTNTDLMDGIGTIQNLREAVRLLIARAMLRLGHDDLQGSWSDLLACHRLASLATSRAPDVVQLLTCCAIDSVTSNSDAVWLAHRRSAEMVKQCLQDHLQLKTLGRLDDTIDLGERLSALDSVVHRIPRMGIDTNLMLRRTNDLFDLAVTVLKVDQQKARSTELAKIGSDLSARAKDAVRLSEVIPKLIVEPRRVITDSSGRTFLLLMLPAFESADLAWNRSELRRDLVRIGFAVATYRAEKGSYPQSLDELQAGTLDRVPVDRFTDEPFVYNIRQNGFQIYSLGPNGKDDQDQIGTTANDDVSFEVPPKPVE